MGSSSSAARAPKKASKSFTHKLDAERLPKPGLYGWKDVDSHGFPTDQSIKSMSMDFDEEPTSPSALYLQSLVHDQEEEIRRLKEDKVALQNKVVELQKIVDQFRLQLPVVAEPRTTHPDPSRLLPKPTQPKTPTPIKADLGDGEVNLPRIGDHVVAMWGQSKWQYFTATIQRFDKKSLKYTIEWDDHDPTGRIIDYYNLAVDKMPSTDQVGVGSKVLFHQGKYKSSEVQGVTRSGGLRWHQGQIDKIYDNSEGTKLYDGHHTKGEMDGKWVTYKDYSDTFTGYTLEDFRMPPNVFDILSSMDDENPTQVTGEHDEEDDFDAFVSYAKINCPSAIKSKEITEELPPSYEEAILSTMCDPRNIVERLKAMGVRVFTKEDDGDSSLPEILSALKKVKVFIACLSDEYASNDRCRMEFQYAKKTLKLPVIPLVVGAGSFRWQMTVVGLLIAGELFIHFKNIDVEISKMTELTRAIQNHIPNADIKDFRRAATGSAQLQVSGKPLVSGTADFFFSYCWLNSKDALNKQQIVQSDYVGKELSDPRAIVKRLSSFLKLQAWLDIERLTSAAGNMGMFGQIATAMNDCKMVIACVSFEYAVSDNCRMELQFAVKSLRKPVLALIVGQSHGWKETVVGKIVEEGLPIVEFQHVIASSQFDSKIKEISQHMQKHIKTVEFNEQQNSVTTSEEGKPKFRAPIPGDHVVCLHQLWAYFMATVESFDDETMNYTVKWDDGDPTGRVQSYQDLALDVVPTDEIAVGSIVIFPQGGYAGTEGNNTGGSRYHQGRITKVYQDENGVTKFDGEHTKGEDESKWITYKGYQQTFIGLTREELRLSPNAMDALMSCKLAYDTSRQ